VPNERERIGNLWQQPLLLTVEQYRQLPDRKDVLHELHWGQVVTLTRPKMRQSRIQYRLVELLPYYGPRQNPKAGWPLNSLSARRPNTICVGRR